MSTTSTIRVNGMTCGHCVAAVTEALMGVDGVDAVDVDLDAGVATVRNGGSVDATALAAAVEGAGYEVAP